MRDLFAHRSSPDRLGRFGVVAVLVVVAIASSSVGSELRNTAIVRVVKKTAPSVVSIHGQKTVPVVEDRFAVGNKVRQVNGMGTGVIIDQRGYIVTNHHVIDGVRQIEVTLADGETHPARLVSRDRMTDLAVIKIDVDKELPVINFGTSNDLMVGEPAIAIGNAYGYDHTVTTGIISSLHRTVLVSDTQKYEDQIQTSAGINPGNSGGPLMNIDGEMVGINVAVRAGAQNIAFAIPIDRVLEVAAELLSVASIDGNWHGIELDSPHGRNEGAIVKRVEPDSPADECGIEPGDEFTMVGDVPIHRTLDLERALLGRKSGEEVDVTVKRDDRTVKLSLVLARKSNAESPQISVRDLAWEMVGLRLAPVSPRQLEIRDTHYNGGLAVTAVRPDSPADREGIRRGDVLVGMHKYEIVSMDNLAYVLNMEELPQLSPVKFYVVRGQQTLWGRLSMTDSSQRATAQRHTIDSVNRPVSRR